MTDIPDLPVPTLPEAVDRLKAQLPNEFPVNNQDPFGRFGTWLALAAQAGIDAREFTRGLLPSGFALYATGDWLDLHAEGLSLSRIQASRAEGVVQFSTLGVLTVPAGTVVQTTGGEGIDLRFLVIEDTDISAPGGPVTVRAELTGAAFNVGPGRVTTLVTLIPGVTAVTNLPDWLTVAGIDRETDDQLRERVLLRFPASGTGTTYHAYILQAREVPGILKVRVLDEHPRGQGTVDVIVAPASGLPTTEQLEQAQALIEKRRPVTADVQAFAPDPQTIPLSVRLYAKVGVETPISIWEARIKTVIDGLGIGETFYPSALLDALHNTGEIHGAQMLTTADPVAAQSETHLILAGALTVTL